MSRREPSPALVVRFEDPRTQLAVCQWVRRLWIALVAINAAGAAHEALTGDWMTVLNLGAIAGIAGAYRWALHPMLIDAHKAYIRQLERELGMR